MEIGISREEDFISIKLSGVIDEDNDLASQCLGIHDQRVTIHLGEVERINSCGVRDWVNLINELEARGSTIVLLECSPAIVAQINLVNNFTGSGSVESFYAPYFCSQCHEEKSVLCQAWELRQSAQLPPIQRCDGCDRFMDFDDMPDAYFAFLGSETKIVGPRKLPLPAPPAPPARLVETQVPVEIEAFETVVALDAPSPRAPSLQEANRRALQYLPWGLLAIAVSALAFVLVAGT